MASRFFKEQVDRLKVPSSRLEVSVSKNKKSSRWNFLGVHVSKRIFNLLLSSLPGCKKILSTGGQFVNMTFFRGLCITVSPQAWKGVHIALYLRRIIVKRKLIPQFLSREFIFYVATSRVGILDSGLSLGKVICPKSTRALVYDSRALPLFLWYLMKKVHIAYCPLSMRAELWNQQHVWGVRKMDSLIDDFGGFFRKIGQIMGTASHLMPPQYVECFSRTMDNHRPIRIGQVTRKVQFELSEPLKVVFEEFSTLPAATASIAQVHFARLRDGRPVAVKLCICEKSKMVGDVENMLRTSKLLKTCRMDGGIDLPTILASYLDVIHEEFDFEVEARTMLQFTDMLASAGLSDRIAIPGLVLHLSTKRMLVMERFPGERLVDVLSKPNLLSQHALRGSPRTSSPDFYPRVPICPPRVAWKHLPVWQTSPGLTGPLGGNSWEGVFHTLHRAWGQMILVYGVFHSDPHPGNIMLLPDGRLGLIDFGQKKVLTQDDRLWMCRLVLAMSGEDYPEVAALIRGRSDFELEEDTQAALNLIAYTFYDTRWTPLAGVNMFDFNNSPLVHNRVVRNSQEGFMIARVVCLFRGMMNACNVESSMVKVWEPIARQALIDAGEQAPSAAAVTATRLNSKAKVTYGLLNGNRRMAEDDRRRGTSPRPQPAPWDFISS